jgi:hypothetical protein
VNELLDAGGETGANDVSRAERVRPYDRGTSFGASETNPAKW